MKRADVAGGSGTRRFGLIAALIAALATGMAAVAGEQLPYLDPSLSPRERALDLLSRMTLAEKIGQITLVYMHPGFWEPDIGGYKIGSIFGGEQIMPNTPLGWAKYYNRIQKLAMDNSRLGIPLLWGTDAVHGNSLLLGATVLPHHIGMGATWNPALAEEYGRVTAVELRAVGRRWSFSPTIDVARNDRWGRTFETYSEDPYLCGILAAHEVNGLQGSDLTAPHAILACAKHYMGAGGTVEGTGLNGGLDRGDLVAPMRIIREVHLQPFIYCVRGGLQTAMASFSSVNGVRVHGSRDILTDILKNELGLENFIVTDWEAIRDADPDYTTAVDRGINAGIDMDMVPETYANGKFQQAMDDLIASGRIPMTRIDDAVYRILLAKFRSGLFEDIYLDEKRTWVVGCAAHRRFARRAVQESQVLLKNDRLLPLSKTSSIFVTGPSADNIVRQCGGWTAGWQEAAFPPPGTTILQAIRKSTTGNVTFSPDGTGAAGHDVAIVVLGETPYAEFMGDTKDLDVPPEQLALADAVTASGVPTVVILVTGRPRTGFESRLAGWRALLAAWLPGIEGQGVTDVLFGDVDASGRLSHSWPKRNDQVPINYDHRPGEAFDPLFDFGYGLSYTTFAYRNLTVTPSQSASVTDQIQVRVEVQNEGTRAGSEVVQVYVKDVESTLSTPVKKLCRFKKVPLEAGQTGTVSFAIPVGEFAYFTDTSERILEPGVFQIMVGGLTASFEMTTGGTVLPQVQTFVPSSWGPIAEPPPPVPAGSGTGLLGQYYTSTASEKFAALTKTVVDPTVDFERFVDKLRKETGQAENCAVRWTGFVEAQYSESYTFYARTDDGVRLWVDGKMLVDHWSDRAVDEDYNSLALLAGRRYPIAMEFYQGWGAAVAQLSWSSISVPKQIIPQTQLYGPQAAEPSFLRGDSNADGKVNVSDAIATLTHLFRPGNPLSCPDAADANDNGAVNIADPIYVLSYLFARGDAPPRPGPIFCGYDPTPDGLVPCVYPARGCE